MLGSFWKRLNYLKALYFTKNVHNYVDYMLRAMLWSESRDSAKCFVL